MAEILITGMEMPKSCETCQLATVNYYNTWCPLAKCFMKRGYSFKDCPLVELPPHGRLIEENKAYDSIMEQTANHYIDMDGVDLGLQNTPTIVEAST